MEKKVKAMKDEKKREDASKQITIFFDAFAALQ